MISSTSMSGDVYNAIKKYSLKVGQAQVQNLASNETLKKVIEVPNGHALRVHFAKLRLGKGNAIRITSYADGKKVTMNDRVLAAYNYATPYFNGGKVLLEVYVPNIRNFQGVQVTALESPYTARTSRSICGKEDNRVPSKISAVARMMKTATGSGGCSATMISETCMISAGHCSAYLNIAQFNVPASDDKGKVRYPAPEDQYPLDKIYDYKNAGRGEDWAVYKLKPNPITQRNAGKIQGYLRIKLEPMTKGDQLIITGFGTDRDDPNRNLAQQTHGGVLVDNGESNAALAYRVDTMPGNSGSGVIDRKTGALIGVHTHGGCNSISETSTNYGTSLAHNEAFKKAALLCLQEERARRRGR